MYIIAYIFIIKQYCYALRYSRFNRFFQQIITEKLINFEIIKLKKKNYNIKMCLL